MGFCQLFVVFYVVYVTFRSEMESQKVHNRYVTPWQFKEDNSARATAEKIFSVCREGLITDWAVRK